MNKQKIAGIALLGFNALSLNAQETEPGKNKLMNTFKERKTELGALGQIFYGPREFRGQALMGIQFKRWVKPDIAFRVMAAYNPYNYSQRPYVKERYSADSLKVQYSRSSVDMIALGFGIEVQRQFYKRVFFFAGLELLAGYGTGTTTSFSKIVPVEDIYYTYMGSINPDYDATFYRKSYAKVLPGVGAKIVFDKINFGLEAQFASIGIDSESNGTRRTTMPNIDLLGNMAYRFHVDYRF